MWKRNPRNDAVLWWGAVAGYAALIFLLSSNPRPPQPATMIGLNIPDVDKIEHFFLYMVFGGLLEGAYERTEVPEDRTILFSFVLGVVYAFTDEVHQYFVPGRSCDFLDFLTDAAGISAGIALVVWKRRNL